MPKRKLKGRVVSNKMSKTLVVEVVRLTQHPKYKKYIRETNRYKAHYDSGEYRLGDTVFIEETRPLSKDKRWQVVGKVNNQDTMRQDTNNDQETISK